MLVDRTRRRGKEVKTDWYTDRQGERKRKRTEND